MSEEITQYDIESFEYRAEQQWKEGEEHPKLLFKYKGISTIDQLCWLIKGIEEDSLHFPTVRELNDSLEGRGAPIFSSDSIIFECEEADNYRVLSLSATCFSPVMWSHYANNRSGVCLGFYNGNPYRSEKNSAFKWAEHVTYCKADELFHIDKKSAIEFGLLHKMEEWGYEQEWRVISSPDPKNKEEKNKKFYYEKDDLACIIFGEKTVNTIKELLRSRFPSIRFYEVRHDAEHYRLVLNRCDKDIAINSVEELINDLQGE